MRTSESRSGATPSVGDHGPTHTQGEGEFHTDLRRGAAADEVHRGAQHRRAGRQFVHDGVTTEQRARVARDSTQVVVHRRRGFGGLHGEDGIRVLGRQAGNGPNSAASARASGSGSPSTSTAVVQVQAVPPRWLTDSAISATSARQSTSEVTRIFERPGPG
ncbi:hypothetical protein ACIHAX_25335 [Nocardia sp. NPDC051929]|uniref:hypothetical protein n=1 Tax=Nocardia sp. NPDC051929 TaxID=3364327 RepID=UPI0037C5926A